MGLVGRAAFVVWLAVRLFVRIKPSVLTISTDQGELPMLFLDASFLLLGLSLIAFFRAPPSAREVRGYVAALAVSGFLSGACLALVRYYRGDALAWDLANFVQPMWRTAHGLAMNSTWHGDRPLWGDHGSFALFLFAPLTRLFDDAATGLLLVQALLTAAFIPALYALSLVFGLSPLAGLALACVAFVSRPLGYAQSFDFHPECALPLLLVLFVWAQRARKLALLALCTLLIVSLKDVTALTLFTTAGYLAFRDRDRVSALCAAAALVVAALDTQLLPSLTGWASYVTMNTSAGVDVALAIKTSLMRALGGGLLGALHPFGLVAGAPWTAAAALSPKILVKGVQFQYGFLFVPCALLGALELWAYTTRRSARALPVMLGWALLTVAVNAPRSLDLDKLAGAHESFAQRRALLASLAEPSDQLASDACTASYVMERATLLPLCQIDTDRIAASGEERWDKPDDRALSASLLLVSKSCSLHGSCLAQQVSRARAAGFVVVHDAGGYLALRRPVSSRQAQIMH
jgi:uncharacterized membrane protein